MYWYPPSQPRGTTFGFSFDDVLKTIASPFDDAVATALNLVSAVPGGDWVRGASRDVARFLISSPGVGIPLVGAISAGLASGLVTGASGQAYEALAPVVGPQAASVAFALPGVVAGDSFSTAWSQEMAKRLRDLAARYGAEVSAEAASQLRSLGLDSGLKDLITPDAVKAFKDANPQAALTTAEALDKMGLGPEAISKLNGGIPPPDVVALAENYLLHEVAYDVNSFSVDTRKREISAAETQRLGYLAGMNLHLPQVTHIEPFRTPAFNTPGFQVRLTPGAIDPPLHFTKTKVAGARVGAAVSTGRELGTVLLMVAPAALALLLLKLPTKKRNRS